MVIAHLYLTKSLSILGIGLHFLQLFLSLGNVKSGGIKDFTFSPHSQVYVTSETRS